MTARCEIVVVDSVTRLEPAHRDQVAIAASHGGAYAGGLAARAGLRGVILNDAGIGLDGAGIGALPLLDGLALPAAAVGHDTARIGDGADMAAAGKVSFVNAHAKALGCEAGQTAMACAEALTRGPVWRGVVPALSEGRYLLRAGPVEVRGLDSASLVRPSDAPHIVVAGSHGGLPGNDPRNALKVNTVAAVFHDAGVGKDRVGIARLAALDMRGVPAATVAADSARIGEAKSLWATGRLSHVNECAAKLGAAAGMTVAEFADMVLAGREG